MRIGRAGKQFKLQWLMYDGHVVAYLASHIMPEREYKQFYNGQGEGLQEAYIIDKYEFGEFARNSDKYYDTSRNAELNDKLSGQIERNPVKSLFDPRAWL